MATKRGRRPNLTHPDQIVADERVFGDLQVERGWALPDSARRVVMGAMAGAIVAPKVPCVGDRHAAQVGADPEYDQELRLLYPFPVMLGVSQLGQIDRFLSGDLLSRSVPAKKSEARSSHCPPTCHSVIYR